MLTPQCSRLKAHSRLNASIIHVTLDVVTLEVLRLLAIMPLEGHVINAMLLWQFHIFLRCHDSNHRDMNHEPLFTQPLNNQNLMVHFIVVKTYRHHN